MDLKLKKYYRFAYIPLFTPDLHVYKNLIIRTGAMFVGEDNDYPDITSDDLHVLGDLFVHGRILTGEEVVAEPGDMTVIRNLIVDGLINVGQE